MWLRATCSKVFREENAVREFDWNDYERLVTVVKHDLGSLEYNIYHTWMLETKKRLAKMVVPALIESQSLPGFTKSDGGGRLFNRLLITWKIQWCNKSWLNFSS
jgi:myosin-5